MQLDSSNKEEEGNIEKIKKELVANLNSLRVTLADSRNKVTKEHNKLKSIREANEECFKKDIQEIHSQYLKRVNDAIKKQQEQIDV